MADTHGTGGFAPLKVTLHASLRHEFCDSQISTVGCLVQDNCLGKMGDTRFQHELKAI